MIDYAIKLKKNRNKKITLLTKSFVISLLFCLNEEQVSKKKIERQPQNIKNVLAKSCRG